MTTDPAPFDPAAALAAGGDELLRGIRDLVFQDAPEQAQLNALERIEAATRSDGLVHLSAEEVERMPVSEWMATYDKPTRERILREVTQGVPIITHAGPPPGAGADFDRVMQAQADRAAARQASRDQQKATTRAMIDGLAEAFGQDGIDREAVHSIARNG